MDTFKPDIWSYLAASPLLGLTITIVAFLIGDWLHKRSGRNPLLIPMLPATLIIIGFLLITDIPYADYFDGAQFVHFLLGPATVALAIPLHRHFRYVKKAGVAIGISILTATLVASLSAVYIASAMGIPDSFLPSIAPKSVTTPIGMGVAEKLGGLPSLAAVIILTTGVIGSVIAQPLIKLFRIKDHKAQGLALGAAAHGVGTVLAMSISEKAGAFAGLAMGLMGVATAILLPLVWGLLF